MNRFRWGNAPASASAKPEAISAVITVAILFSIVTIKHFVSSRPGTSAGASVAPTVARGTTLKSCLPGVDWAKNGRTLVMALSAHCRYCKESAPFYRRINTEAGRSVKLLAVLPQSREESAKFLRDEGVRVDDIRQAEPIALGVPGTPTLLLVDGKGTVVQLWLGRLTRSKQDSVLSMLREAAPGRM